MSAQPTVPPAAQARMARVFISSTFRDMHAEREQLVKYTFPELRRRCRERHVEVIEIDFRWGVTEEQAMRGEVVSACLAEIDQCTHFVALLGERYGELLHGIRPELIEESRLHALEGRSLTEVEILYSTLERSAQPKAAYFYFRDPAHLQHIPPEQQTDFVSDSPDAQTKLATLKQRIRASQLPVRENYPDPETLGQWVFEDLWQAIDQVYPSGPLPDPLDREAAEHEAFTESRAKVYIGRAEYMERLDAHAAGESPPLVVLGESGVGKFALLANWALNYRNKHPDELMLLHFIGASPYSADWAQMLRRILGEFNRRLDLKVEIPDQPDALRLTFANTLHRAAAKGKVVLVLDALNQLEDRNGAPDLIWLPSLIPPNVRLIVSTLPGRPLDVLQRWGWPTLMVEALTPAERLALIEQHLAPWGKALSAARAQRIAAAPQSANPLYLRALLDELRVFGAHERLEERIAYYLAAETIPTLYQRILQRYEDDYELHRPGLVRDAMTLLWAARRGLSENELLELLGTDGQPLPTAWWSPLYLAAEASLMSRSGLIGFFHDYLRQAIMARYLPTEQAREAAHLRLADHFAAQDADPRKIDELPWQWAEAKAWPQLYALLADLPFFVAAWAANPFEVKVYWAQIEAHSPLTMLAAHRPVLDAPEAVDPRHVWTVGSLLADTGHLEEALRLHTYLVNHYRQVGDRQRLSGSVGSQGLILYDRGDLDGAMTLHKEQERLCRELGDPAGLSGALGNQALILRYRGDLDGAMALYKEQERLCRELGDPAGLSVSLGNQAVILRYRGELDGAMALHKEEERLCHELGDPAGLSVSLGNQAVILRDRGYLDGAMALYKEQERLCRELGDPAGLSVSLGNQAVILRDRGYLDGAMALYKEQERLCRELGNKEGLQRSLGNQANILFTRGDLDGAMALYKEQERLCRELGDPAGLSVSLGNQALILRDRGYLDGAMALYKEQERLCRELGDPAGLSVSLGNQAVILRYRGELDGAMALHKEEERLCRELGSKDGLTRSLGSQANVFYARGDLDWAMALHKEEERLCRELGDPEGLSVSLGNQALILRYRGDLDGAMALYKEQERLCRELGDPAELSASLGNQGLILYDRGDLDGAMALYKEQERLCRELGNKDGLQISLGNQGLILYDRGDLDGAMALYKEQERLCRELGNKDGLQISLGNQGLILYDRDDLDGAIALHKETERLCRELGSKDGLTRSLGNQANVFYARGDLDGAMALYKEQERLCRELGNKEGLAISLANQANLLSEKMNRPREGLPLIEEAHHLATDHKLTALAQQIKPILDRVRAKVG